MTVKSGRADRTFAALVYRSLWWRAGVIVIAIVAAAGYPMQDKPAMAAEPGPARLVGWWMRTDGGYVLALNHPIFDGRLTAAYFNPQPINVARAEWKLKDGHLIVVVEFRDKDYPGSTYNLVYQPGMDRLVGIYFQAALQQRFEVVFERMK